MDYVPLKRDDPFDRLKLSVFGTSEVAFCSSVKGEIVQARFLATVRPNLCDFTETYGFMVEN